MDDSARGKQRERPQPTQPPTVERTDADKNDPQALSQAVGTMKQEIQDEAKRLTSPAPMGKPQPIAEACSVMKEEIYGRSPAIDDDRSPAEETVELSPAERDRQQI